MNRKDVNTMDREHYMTRFCGKAVVVILSILFITRLWFLKYKRS